MVDPVPEKEFGRGQSGVWLWDCVFQVRQFRMILAPSGIATVTAAILNTICITSVLIMWFADACADSSHAGIGGFVKLPSGKCAWFRQRFSVRDLCSMFPWFTPDTSPQACIAAWELLGQMALLWVVALFVPAGSHPLHVVTRCDNSPADSASWKGLSTARGLCNLLPVYFAWQRLFCISTYIDHVPGFRNTIADALSRDAEPASLGLAASDEVTVPWSLISNLPRPSYSPSSALNTSLFPAMDF